ncbi:hypothetical protein ACSVBT_12465 [Afipia sp. TerB]|jgi:hypothetical protein
MSGGSNMIAKKPAIASDASPEPATMPRSPKQQRWIISGTGELAPKQRS